MVPPDPRIDKRGEPTDPSEDNWLGVNRGIYWKWVRLLAVAAVPLNVLTELHYRQITRFRLPENIAPIISHLAEASGVLLIAGAVGGVMFYLNERRYNE